MTITAFPQNPTTGQQEEIGGITYEYDGTKWVGIQSVDADRLADASITGNKIANDAVTLGTQTTGDYIDNITGGTTNSSGLSSIEVAGTAGEGWEPALELSFNLSDAANVADPPTVANFNGKKFLFTYE